MESAVFSSRERSEAVSCSLNTESEGDSSSHSPVNKKRHSSQKLSFARSHAHLRAERYTQTTCPKIKEQTTFRYYYSKPWKPIALHETHRRIYHPKHLLLTNRLHDLRMSFKNGLPMQLYIYSLELVKYKWPPPTSPQRTLGN